MASRCPICEQYLLKSDEEKSAGVCTRCKKLPGFFQLPPLTRPLLPCAACGGRELVRAVAFERGAGGADDPVPYAAPLAVAFRRRANRAGWSPRARSVGIHDEDLMSAIGWLELLICRACGLVSWHALEPLKIPIGPEYGTELVRADDAGGPPYR